MVHLTVFASILATLMFSSAALKIMNDTDKVLPAKTEISSKSCQVLTSKN